MFDTASSKLYELTLLTHFEHLAFIDSVRTHFTASLGYDDSYCVLNCQVLGSGVFKQFRSEKDSAAAMIQEDPERNFGGWCRASSSANA